MNYIFYIFNIAGFKVCWWACVWGATSNQKYLGPFLVLLYLIVHIYSISYQLRNAEIYLLCIAGILGTVVDSLFLNLDFLSYKGLYDNIDYIAPLWITAMWVGFTATLNHAFKKIINKYSIQAILGMIFGPIAYITGKSLGAIEFNSLYSQNNILIIISIAWGISFPFLCWMSNKIRKQ